MPARPTNRVALRILIGGSCLLFGLFAFFYGRGDFREGDHDFVMFYVAAQTAGGNDLYHPDLYRQFEARAFDSKDQSTLPVRLPFYFWILKPLSWFEYQDAHLIWTAIRLAAIALFLWTLPRTWRGEAAMFSAASFPLMSSFARGHDSALLPAIIGLSMFLDRRGRRCLAGAVLSLLSIKYHLFLTVPLVIAAQRRWDLARGFAIGAGIQVIVSFWIAGPTWPLEYYAIVTTPAINSNPVLMPNLHGLVVEAPASNTMEALLAAIVAFTTWRIARHRGLAESLGLAFIGGLLISYHAYLPDAVVLIPAAMFIGTKISGSALHLGITVLLLPPIWLLLLMGRPYSYLPQVSLLLAFALIATKFWRPEKTTAGAIGCATEL